LERLSPSRALRLYTGVPSTMILLRSRAALRRDDPRARDLSRRAPEGTLSVYVHPGPLVAAGAPMLESAPLSALFVCTLLAVGCGSRTDLDVRTSSEADAGGSLDSGRSSRTPDSGVDFPVGTFASCAEGFFGPDGNTFLNTSGVTAGAVLTVAHDGPQLTANFKDENGVTSEFTFNPTTDTSAALSGSSVVAGFGGLCVQGPGDEGSFAATVNVASGALTYDASTMFVSLEGTVTGGQDSPCGASKAPARIWIVCGSSPSSPSSSGVGATARFPTGTYSCNSQIGTYIAADGLQQYATSGDLGVLVVTQSGATVTASYSEDSSIAGMLDFTVTSPTTANVVAGESLAAPCTVPIVTEGPPPAETPEPLSVAAASLQVTGTALSLSFRGKMTSSCTGALAMGSLLCTKNLK
jgi:hypothetical protein